MAQARLVIDMLKPQAEECFARLDTCFEEESWPLALNEIDEAHNLYEIALYVGEKETCEKVRARFCQAGNFDEGDVRIEILPDIDWVRHALDGLAPVRVGRFFLHGSHDRDRIRAYDMAIEIDAGLAFGTGHHGTTCGCLEMMTCIMRREQIRSFADLGTGSGVLAIAAARILSPDKAGAVRLLASDIDPVAVRVARENMRRNHVAPVIETITAAGLHHRRFKALAPFDLITANILARPLIKLAPTLAPLVKKRGSLILSGLLDGQRDSVLAAYRHQGLYHRTSIHREGWATLHLIRGS